MNKVGCYQRYETSGNDGVKCFVVFGLRKKNPSVKVLSLEICINVALLFPSVDTF